MLGSVEGTRLLAIIQLSLHATVRGLEFGLRSSMFEFNN